MECTGGQSTEKGVFPFKDIALLSTIWTLYEITIRLL